MGVDTLTYAESILVHYLEEVLCKKNCKYKVMQIINSEKGEML